MRPGGGNTQAKRTGKKTAGGKSLLDPLPLPSSPLRRAPAPTQHGSTRASQRQPPAPAPAPAPKPISNARPKLLTLTAVAVFAFSTYGSYLYITYQKAIERSKSLTVPLDVSDRYDKTAATYDTDVKTSEWMMGLDKKRKELVERARGDVVEVSCGTGRNLEYYELGERRGTDRKGKAEVKGCRSVTFVDQSGEMVEVAREKFEKMFPAFKQERERGRERGVAPVAFRAQDAMEPIEPAIRPAKPRVQGDAKFDTVIQTMGLCSHPDPVRFLRHMGTITEPERGKILLLEHGRSYYGWVNRLLDDLAPAHADRHGCWWNRDIGEIVERSGLEVVETKRWHLGTTWLYILRPRGP